MVSDFGLPEEHKSPEKFLAAFDLGRVPTEPGCYIMRASSGKVIYVGKAKNLRSRLRTYINEQDSRYSVKFLMRRVTNIDFLITTNEKEALLLENSLIKEYKPRYNVHLKDDKTYVSIRLNVQDDFPRITVMRRGKKDGAVYYGPYSSAHSVRETVRQVHRMFPLRRCTDTVMKNRIRPCLYHQIKQCVAPCVGLIDRDLYHEIVKQVQLVLNGNTEKLERLLREQIHGLAEKLDFENAAVLRDRLYALQRTVERQRTVAVPGAQDRDVFGAYNQGHFAEIQIIFFRKGKMLGGRSFSFKRREMPLDEVLSSFVLQYYSEIDTMEAAIPAEVLMPMPLEDASILAEVLSEKKGSKVAVHSPMRGDKLALVEMANRNAKSSFEEKRLAEKASADLLEQLRVQIGLSKVPNRIECFDISTIQGTKSVGAMVTFDGGEANKSRYRRYSIREVKGQDDYAMLREVIMRRYKRAIEEEDLPDLVIIDGGKGQLNVARAAFTDLAIEDLDVIGLAKSRAERGGSGSDAVSHSPERVFIPGRKNPIVLKQNSPLIHLLARIRDEAHRFAITYHRKQRKKATLSTQLTDIPGVGPKRARILLKELGSPARIKAGTVQQIAALPGFSEELAETIKAHLRKR